jgi:hypothetical protein
VSGISSTIFSCLLGPSRSVNRSSSLGRHRWFDEQSSVKPSARPNHISTLNSLPGHTFLGHLAKQEQPRAQVPDIVHLPALLRTSSTNQTENANGYSSTVAPRTQQRDLPPCIDQLTQEWLHLVAHYRPAQTGQSRTDSYPPTVPPPAVQAPSKCQNAAKQVVEAAYEYILDALVSVMQCGLLSIVPEFPNDGHQCDCQEVSASSTGTSN